MTEDGSIVINTKIRTDGIKAGTAEIEAGVHRAADRVNTLGSNVKKTLNNQIDSFVKLNDEYSTQEQKVESLRQKVAAYANQRIPTTEYKEITAQIEQAQEKLNRLNDAKERFGATGGKVNSTSYKKMQYDIDELANTIKYAKLELDDLEASGKAFISGVNTKEAQADMEKLTAAEKKLSDMQKQLHTSYQSITDAHKKATKAAKDYLSPLDEINRYTTNKDTDTTPSGSDVNGTPISKMFEEVPIDAPPIFEKIKDVLGQIFQPFKEAWEREGKNTIDAAKYALSELGALAKSVGSSMLEVWTNGTGTQILSTMLQIAQGLLTTVGNIARQLDIAWNKNAVGTAIIQAIADAFQKVLDIINRLVWDTAQWAGSLDFYPLLNSIKNLFESMSPLIEAIGSFLERLYTNIILPMLKFLIENGLPFLINLLAGLFDFLGEHQWIIDAIGAALLGAFVSSKISPLVLGIRSAITSLIGVFTGAGGLSGAISMIVTAFDRFAVASNVIPIAIALAVAAIVLIITHWDQLKAAMSKLMDWIKGVFSVDWNAQLGVLGEGIEVLLSTVKGIFNSIKQICSGFITFLKGAFTGNIDMALKGVLGILRGVANLVFSIFKTPVNEVIALFNAMGQTIVKAINNLIDGLNHIKVPDWVPGIGGKGINLSHANFRRVPYLAQGAVIPAGNPFLAVLGDQTRGNNLEMPENLLRKIVSEESGKGTGMIKLVVNLDSRTVLERLINTAKEMQMSNGQNVFELGR